MKENDAFCEFAHNLLAEQYAYASFSKVRSRTDITPFSKSVIPSLSLGMSLSSPHLPPERLDSFMRRMLVSRISRRVLAEHHIALTKFIRDESHPSHPRESVGIISTGLRVKDCIEQCTRYLQQRPHNADGDTRSDPISRPPWSEVIIDGHSDVKFAYIREHLE